MRLTALALGVALLCGSGCQCGSVVITGTDDGGGGGGGGAPGDGGGGGPGDGGGGPDGGVACGATSCGSPNVCRFGVCVDPPPACTLDGECQTDSYCEAGECIPYGVGPRGGTNPECKRLTVVGLFAPRALCEWKAPPAGDPYPGHLNVLSTPLVADFDFDNNPATVRPSIVFTTYNCADGACGAQPGCYGVIRVIDGQNCQQQYNVGGPAGDTTIIGDVTPAIGDINGDGRPDIVTEHIGGGVMGFGFQALAGTPHFAALWTNYASFNAAGCHWDSLALHDLDDDGVPEIVQNGPFPAVYSNTGLLIDGSTVDTTYSALLHPVLADLDGDGQVELVDGRETLRFDKITKKWAVAQTTANALGQVAIADFGTFGSNPALDDRGALDGVPEIAAVSVGVVRVQALDGRVVFGPLPLPAGGSGGAPTVADFDGDTRAEVGVAGAAAYSVFDPDCVPAGVSTTCPSGAINGVLWSKASQDASSNVTGSSVFDFEADGNAEVVYADECFSRVYSGTTGEVLFSQYHTSCTWYENPIVADVNGDYRSEVVIPSNESCSVSCPALDPVHDGVRCESGADCPGATTCGREVPTDKYGRCRCTQTSECGSPSLSCADRIGGPSAAGMVCRAFHPPGAPQHGV
ncbi:MAG: FG-GAP repeat domain-containing protein, partial [Myxococcaceae bacterium]